MTTWPATPACWSWPIPSLPSLKEAELIMESCGVELDQLTPWAQRPGLIEIARFVEFHRGRCAICGRIQVEMATDHDHSTGYVRGYLCGSCNPVEGRSVLKSPTTVFADYRVRNPAALLGYCDRYPKSAARLVLKSRRRAISARAGEIKRGHWALDDLVTWVPQLASEQIGRLGTKIFYVWCQAEEVLCHAKPGEQAEADLERILFLLDQLVDHACRHRGEAACRLVASADRLSRAAWTLNRLIARPR